ncbi:LysR family transcriptional regulator [Vibrio hepatarius]|uniref:LysR family transcriptional regulator n=1 Tax=Vibrio hepatarius TaxID=171383 RepID=UPI001C0995AD|nr:LysR family transcriptional regulator [Vibrio hepatarius]MBU2895793.1 LysR family transcriptional regulator [Vibrio hepatarius]
MDIDSIRAYCELAHQGNYRLAASKLFITQSAVTKKIQRLEDELGATLFYRGRNGASLTNVGLSLLPEAKSLLKHFDKFNNISKQIAEGKAGLLKIGFGISSYSFATKAIANFTKTNSNIKVSINDIPSQKQIEMLRNETLDISFCRLPIPADLDSVLVTKDKLVLATHRSIYINKSSPVETVESMNLNYMKLNPKRGPGIERLTQKYMSQIGKILVPEREANDILTLVTMISSNLGYSILPASTAYISNEQIKFTSLPNCGTSWDVGIVWNPEIENTIRDEFIQQTISLTLT